MLPVEREHIGNKLHISRLVVHMLFCFHSVGMVRRERRKEERKEVWEGYKSKNRNEE